MSFGSVAVTNLVEGPGNFYVGLFGAVEPADASVNAAPAASAWTDLGGTLGGLELTIAQNYKELEVDQVVDSVGRRLVSRDVMVKTNMAEPTLDNLMYALNDGTSATGANFKSYTPVIASSATQPTYRALIMDGWAPGGVFNRRILGRKVLSIEDVKIAYKKDEQSVWSVTWAMHYVTGSIALFKIVDQTV